MAQFKPAYDIVRANEGYYANHPADKGGETYAGIARNIWPNWDGWDIIDFYKRTRGASLSATQPVPGIESRVEAFYKKLWQTSRAGEINDQAVANNYFDFYVLHSKAVRAMQEVLNGLGFTVAIDNIIGPQTLNAINAADPARLHDAYKQRRIAYHDARVQQDPSQQVFYNGWIKRAMAFPDMVSTGGILLVLAAATAIVYFGIKSNTE